MSRKGKECSTAVGADNVAAYYTILKEEEARECWNGEGSRLLVMGSMEASWRCLSVMWNS